MTVAFLLLACCLQEQPPSAAEEPLSPKKQSDDQTDANIGKGTDGVIAKDHSGMSPERKLRFLESLKALKSGDPYDMIVKLLGRPDLATSPGKIISPPPKRKTIVYIIRRANNRVIDLNYDQYVSLRFDNQRLVEISTNVAELQLQSQIKNVSVSLEGKKRQKKHRSEPAGA
jgi:hypothetical protein